MRAKHINYAVVDTALEKLAADLKPGQTLTRKQIAKATGVDNETVRSWERNALAKLSRSKTLFAYWREYGN